MKALQSRNHDRNEISLDLKPIKNYIFIEHTEWNFWTELYVFSLLITITEKLMWTYHCVKWSRSVRRKLVLRTFIFQFHTTSFFHFFSIFFTFLANLCERHLCSVMRRLQFHFIKSTCAWLSLTIRFFRELFSFVLSTYQKQQQTAAATAMKFTSIEKCTFYAINNRISGTNTKHTFNLNQIASGLCSCVHNLKKEEA